MELFNFYTAYTQLHDLYGIELTPDQFENIGMIAWSKIGNKMMTTKNTILEAIEGVIDLPCDIDEIEAITTNVPEFQKSSNMSNYWQLTNELYTEQYTRMRRGDKADLFTEGEFIKYDVIGPRRIKIDPRFTEVNVMYRSIIMDELDLPLLNSKEVDAIASYCAYSDVFKKGLMTRDGNMINLSQSLEQKWLKACDHARTPIHMSQNDFDAIGDVKYSWDRKSYGKSFKPVR